MCEYTQSSKILEYKNILNPASLCFLPEDLTVRNSWDLANVRHIPQSPHRKDLLTELDLAEAAVRKANAVLEHAMYAVHAETTAEFAKTKKRSYLAFSRGLAAFAELAKRLND